MKDTAYIYKSEALTVLDSSSRITNNLLARWFRNSIDGIRFYGFMGQASQVPVLGPLLKKSLHLYYRYLHTNSLVFPLKELEEVIESATDIYVDACGCRLAADDKACEAPLFVCMRINNSAKLRKEQKNSRGLSKDDALAIMRQARKHGMVFSLESCNWIIGAVRLPRYDTLLRRV